MSNNVSPWATFSGPNLGYVMEMYDLFLTSPEEVDAELVALFEQYGAPVIQTVQTAGTTTSVAASTNDITKVLAAVKYADAIRNFGHLASDIYPLNNQAIDTSRIEASAYGLSDADLIAVPASTLLVEVPAKVRNGLDAVNYLKEIYTGKIAFEFNQVVGQEEKAWIQSKIESGSLNSALSTEDKKEALKLLNNVEGFEQFMHKTFVGVKRFSIEGVDALVVLIDELINKFETKGTKDIQIGMAHRGRLNVLTHNVHKPYKMMLADFAHVPSDLFVPEDGSLLVTKGWSGDAKYHLGAKYTSPNGSKISLAYNPSHLEVVSPVVNGATRAVQEDTSKPGLPVQDKSKSVSILVHGDAAFAGQGVVAEGFNYANTRGFTTGGSVHIIANNMIGFTTERFDSRSTVYSSDSAKGYEVPVLHVNADAPEAVIQAARFAVEYRATFGKDILVDLIGYRRYGHNEMDEPMITNPEMYNIVHKHDTVRALYGKQLVAEGVVTDAEVANLQAEIKATLQDELDEVRAAAKGAEPDHSVPQVVLDGFPEVQTGVGTERLTTMNAELLDFPEEFHVFKKLSKILSRRNDPFVGKGKIDWGHAETLAFGTIIQDGHPVRLTGQDAQRGTFAHRHLVLHDEQNGEELTMLHHISGSNASFDVVNSSLSEGSILAYEWGYNVENQNALAIWEAQYGDFANMAQVIFDNFISAADSKWGIKSGLVMLLPHAAEGQGSEHTSARLERFLQLSAENNWTVANLSSAANYFHLLRRQAAMLGTDSIRPLVLVSPKSLLRNQMVAATVEELATGQFETIIEHPTTGKDAKKVEKLVFASGKMAIDIAEKVGEGEGFEHLHLVRVEQLYPFPAEKIAAIIAKYPKVKTLAWAQEEPKNMGSWTFADPYLRELAGTKEITYVGRGEHSSPAEGDPDSFKVAQTKVIEAAVSK